VLAEGVTGLAGEGTRGPVGIGFGTDLGSGRPQEEHSPPVTERRTATMIRILLAGLLIATAALVPNLSAHTVGDMPHQLRGSAEGLWQLPTDGQPGQMVGLLVTNGNRTLVMEARLGPLQLVGDRWIGRMEGFLYRSRGGQNAGRPIARVRGRYGVGPLGNGRFEAGFLPLEPDTDEAPRRIGRVWGMFHDQATDQAREPGRFIGQWVLGRP
jgi:hypothetical protein